MGAELARPAPRGAPSVPPARVGGDRSGQGSGCSRATRDDLSPAHLDDRRPPDLPVDVGRRRRWCGEASGPAIWRKRASTRSSMSRRSMGTVRVSVSPVPARRVTDICGPARGLRRGECGRAHRSGSSARAPRSVQAPPRRAGRGRRACRAWRASGPADLFAEPDDRPRLRARDPSGYHRRARREPADGERGLVSESWVTTPDVDAAQRNLNCRLAQRLSWPTGARFPLSRCP